MTTSLRTIKTKEEYDKFQAEGNLKNGCKLCDKNEDDLIQEFKYWKIIKNKFPWDLISKLNHLMIPKRHTIYGELNEEEKKEQDFIKSDYIEGRYDIIAEALPHAMSIPEHYHSHLIVLKDKIGE